MDFRILNSASHIETPEFSLGEVCEGGPQGLLRGAGRASCVPVKGLGTLSVIVQTFSRGPYFHRWDHIRALWVCRPCWALGAQFPVPVRRPLVRTCAKVAPADSTPPHDRFPALSSPEARHTQSGIRGCPSCFSRCTDACFPG